MKSAVRIVQSVATGVSIAGLALSATVSLRGTHGHGQSGSAVGIEYKVVATSKTSTMEKELNQAAESGFQFDGVMGGETAFGGNEVVVVMSRASGITSGKFGYRLLATSKTSTMQKELQAAAEAGFQYRGQTVFDSAFGGEEVVCILERDGAARRPVSTIVSWRRRRPPRSRQSSRRLAPPAISSLA